MMDFYPGFEFSHNTIYQGDLGSWKRAEEIYVYLGEEYEQNHHISHRFLNLRTHNVEKVLINTFDPVFKARLKTSLNLCPAIRR